MMRIPGWTASVVLLCLTTACSLWPAQPPAPQLHDFGPLPAQNEQTNTQAMALSVTAPVWLADDAIHYRLLYDDPTALRSYANHRWAAPPGDLLAARIESLLADGSADHTGTYHAYVLGVRLLVFEQDFTTAHAAQVQLELEVSLTRTRDGQIIAQRRFVMSHSSPADVQGAVSGLAHTADQAAMAITDWARAQIRE